jgi:hypothetical protein
MVKIFHNLRVFCYNSSLRVDLSIFFDFPTKNLNLPARTDLINVFFFIKESIEFKFNAEPESL